MELLTQALTGKDVDPSVVNAGVWDSASEMTLSFPAIHLMPNGWSRIFLRSLVILALSIWAKFLAKIRMSGL